jgi:UDP-glucose 6-dehydrogenase
MIYEEDLDPLLRETVTGKKLIATKDMVYAVNNSEVSIIAVGTPYIGESIYLTYFQSKSDDVRESQSAKFVKDLMSMCHAPHFRTYLGKYS